MNKVAPGDKAHLDELKILVTKRDMYHNCFARDNQNFDGEYYAYIEKLGAIINNQVRIML